MKVKLFHQLQVHDKNGELEYDSGKVPSHSFVIQFLELLYGFLGESGDLDATDTSGGESRIYNSGQVANLTGRVDSSATELYGVVVGLNTTGPTAESNTNFKLDTIVDHGDAAGELNHQAVVFVTARDVAGNIELDVSRPFINNSGGQIDIEEIGVITREQGAGSHYHLIMRDVIGTTPVADTSVLTVTYVLQTTA